MAIILTGEKRCSDIESESDNDISDEDGGTPTGLVTSQCRHTSQGPHATGASSAQTWS